MVVQKPGLSATILPYPAFSNTFRGGIVKHSFGSEMGKRVASAVDLQPGDKLYLLGIDVKDSNVTFHVVACGDCNPSVATDPNAARASINFQFQKGYLQSPDIDLLQQTISQLVAPDVSAASASAAPAAQPQPVPPQNIAPGETAEQVMAALGQADYTVNLGAKQIFLYPNLKITLQNGKVSSVQ